MRQRDFNNDPYGAAIAAIVEAINRARAGDKNGPGILGGSEPDVLNEIQAVIQKHDPISWDETGVAEFIQTRR